MPSFTEIRNVAGLSRMRIGPLSTLAQIDGAESYYLRLPQDGEAFRQPGIQIDLRTLTKATRPRPSALSAFSAVKKGDTTPDFTVQ